MAPTKAKKVTLTVNKHPSTKRPNRKKKARDKTPEPEHQDASLGPGNEESETPTGFANTNASDREVDAIRGSSECQSSKGVDVSLTCTYIFNIDILFTAELEEQRRQNAELRKRLEDGQNNGLAQDAAKPIPRPQGTAGTHFSIQEAMGLAGSANKYETYKAIQVRICCAMS